MNIPSIDAILAGLAFIGGLLVTAYVLMSGKAPRLQPWAKGAFVIFGCTCALWGVLKCVMISQIAVLSERAYWHVADTKTLIGGFAIGILVTLILSGEFKKLGKSPEPFVPTGS
jgi:hypothetical protein